MNNSNDVYIHSHFYLAHTGLPSWPLKIALFVLSWCCQWSTMQSHYAGLRRIGCMWTVGMGKISAAEHAAASVASMRLARKNYVQLARWSTKIWWILRPGINIPQRRSSSCANFKLVKRRPGSSGTWWMKWNIRNHAKIHQGKGCDLLPKELLLYKSKLFLFESKLQSCEIKPRNFKEKLKASWLKHWGLRDSHLTTSKTMVKKDVCMCMCVYVCNACIAVAFSVT